MTYYLKIFFLYSFFGFTMESTLYKISNIPKFSSIFYGPVTTIYGFGIIAIELLNNSFFSRLKNKKIVIIIIEYIILTIVLSIIEFIGGNIIDILFDIDLWNYTDKIIHFGKYVCLTNSLLWGLLGTLYIHVFKTFTDKIIAVITSKETYFFLIIFIVDLCIVLINKL